MKLYLLRHGETDWNKAARFQGQTDIPLNDYGRELAVLTRQNMPVIKFDRVYCSPLCRAVETARIFLEGRFPLEQIQTDNRLKEISFGFYEGTSINAAKDDPEHPMYELLWHPENYKPLDETKGESLPMVAARAGDFLEHEILPLEGLCQHVLVVAHGALNRSMLVAAGLKDIPDFWNAKYPNCCITTLNIEQGRVSLLKEAEVFYDSSKSFNICMK